MRVHGTSLGLLPPAKLVRGRQHGLDVLDGDVLLDVVHLGEDVTAVDRVERFEVVADVFADLFGRAQRQRLLGLAAPQKTMRPPKSRMRRSGSMLAAEICTGFRMSMPASIHSGM